MADKINAQLLTINPLLRRVEWQCEECSFESAVPGGREYIEDAMRHTLATGHETSFKTTHFYLVDLSTAYTEVPHDKQD